MAFSLYFLKHPLNFDVLVVYIPYQMNTEQNSTEAKTPKTKHT